MKIYKYDNKTVREKVKGSLYLVYKGQFNYNCPQ